MRKRRSSEGEVSMLPDIVMLSQETLVTCTTSKRMVGSSLVSIAFLRLVFMLLTLFQGNYDISQMHYEGPGAVPGAPGGGYGYDLRVEGLSSANPPPEVAATA
jgi:hypothetical protein